MVQNFGKRPRIDNVSEVYLWHYRLGHINKNRINMLAQEEILEVSDCESLPTCESCLLGKMTKSPLTGKGERATDRKSTRLNSSHSGESRMPSSA